MPRFLALLWLMVLALGALACTDLAASSPPAFVIDDPVAIRDEATQRQNVALKVGVWERHYLVPGLTADEIAENLDDLRLRGAGHGDFSALTKWDLRWSVRYDRQPESCGLEAATIEVYAVITMPALSEPQALDADTLVRWQAYQAAIEEHELMHVDNEVEQAQTFGDALINLAPEADCAALGATITGLGEHYKEAVRQADQRLDAETEHGALTARQAPAVGRCRPLLLSPCKACLGRLPLSRRWAMTVLRLAAAGSSGMGSPPAVVPAANSIMRWWAESRARPRRPGSPSCRAPFEGRPTPSPYRARR